VITGRVSGFRLGAPEINRALSHLHFVLDLEEHVMNTISNAKPETILLYSNFKLHSNFIRVLLKVKFVVFLKFHSRVS
jgi:hypothetical protein